MNEASVEFSRFCERVRSGTSRMVPLCRELLADTLTPTAAFLRLRSRGRPTFLLESVEGGERIGRYSFLGTDPFRCLRADGPRVQILDGDDRLVREEDGSFFEVFAQQMEEFRSVRDADMPPFTGGPVGYIGYDAIRYIESIPDRHGREDGLPDAQFYFHDTVVGFDHARHRVLLITNAHVDPASVSDAELEREYASAVERLDRLEVSLERPATGEGHTMRLRKLPPERVDQAMQSNFTREDFEAAVRRAKEYIFAGDAFQVVLSQRFSRATSADPFEVYRVLRALNPSPYLFFLEWGDTALCGSSPEVLVKVEDRRVSVRPIAGTRPRGKTEAEDRRLEEDLLADEKELAEHRMLVDLGRNDVGRVARFGTVHLPRYLTIERYSHVMHIVSEVEGELRDELSALDAFQGGFPAGTVSGAPKIRAMEIIDELEPTRRGVYAGAVGYLDFAGNLDTCIAIRTIVFHGGEVRIQAGGGVVADSVPSTEFMETVHKATALFEAIRLAEAELPDDPPARGGREREGGS